MPLHKLVCVLRDEVADLDLSKPKQTIIQNKALAFVKLGLCFGLLLDWCFPYDKTFNH